MQHTAMNVATILINADDLADEVYIESACMLVSCCIKMHNIITNHKLQMIQLQCGKIHFRSNKSFCIHNQTHTGLELSRITIIVISYQLIG